MALGRFENWVINNIIDGLFRGQTPLSDSPALQPTGDPLYWCLFDSIAGDVESGYYFPANSEVTYSGYARRTYTFGLNTWFSTQGNLAVSSGTSGVCTLASTIYFPVCTSSTRVVTHVGLMFAFLASEDSYPVIWWELDTPIQLVNSSPGFTPQIAAGALGVSLA